LKARSTTSRVFTQGKELSDYEGDRMLRAAVERKFTIIGEAMAQMAYHYPASRDRIEDARKIVDFRNLLMHEYGEVDDVLVWGVLREALGSLKAEIDRWIIEEQASAKH
jgi:uncharacterized protein with HEPN domain